MATTPEEFFVEGLVAPPSPSVFLDLPPGPDVDGMDPSSSDNLVLPYISQLLMEDDNLLYHCSSDDPALLQAQQSLAQILSTTSSNANNGDTETVGCAVSLQGANGDRSTPNSAFSNRMDVVGAFLKGMEEASKFLPEDNGLVRVEVADQKFRESNTARDVQLEECVSMMAEPEVADAREMFDEMMQREYETCIKDMGKLRMAMDREVEKKKKGGNKVAGRKAVDLRMLLIHCAQAIAADSHLSACELLKEIKKHSSPTGDATQRLAHCFSKGLEARLAGTGRQQYQLLTSKRISDVDFIKAYKLYMAACCFNRVGLMFSAMAIMHAVAGKSRLHIVDYGMHYGLQWAGLLHLLASREGGPPEVKITAVGLPKCGFHPTEPVEETDRRLSNLAHKFGLRFSFSAIAARCETVGVRDLDVDPDEVLVVNDMFNFSTLMDESFFVDRVNPRDVVLNNIRKMRPDLFIQSVANASYGTSFLSRFRETLFYYSALFDMLDATTPRGSETRLVLEQDMLGLYALNVITCEGADLVERPEKYRQWQARNQRAGLTQLPINPTNVKALRDSVNSKYHKDFLLMEDGQWLLQGWMGRILFAHSIWVAQDTSSSP